MGLTWQAGVRTQTRVPPTQASFRDFRLSSWHLRTYSVPTLCVFMDSMVAPFPRGCGGSGAKWRPQQEDLAPESPALCQDLPQASLKLFPLIRPLKQPRRPSQHPSLTAEDTLGCDLGSQIRLSRNGHSYLWGPVNLRKHLKEGWCCPPPFI